MAERCSKLMYFRSMWAFGMSKEEIRTEFRCRRPAGHRGDCGYSVTPPAPLRPVMLTDTGERAHTIGRKVPA